MAGSVPASSEKRDVFSLDSYFIAEDSLSSKIASCIPVIGCFVSSTEKDTLSKKIAQLLPSGEREHPYTNVAKAVQLMKVNKDYLIADLGRNLISLAMIISFTALGVFSGALSVIFIFGFSLAILFDVKNVETQHRAAHAIEVQLERCLRV